MVQGKKPLLLGAAALLQHTYVMIVTSGENGIENMKDELLFMLS